MKRENVDAQLISAIQTQLTRNSGVRVSLAMYATGRITYTWMCDACHARHEESRDFRGGDPLWRPILPRGWKTTGSLATYDLKIYCPKHVIVTLVDGEPLNQIPQS